MPGRQRNNPPTPAPKPADTTAAAAFQSLFGPGSIAPSSEFPDFHRSLALADWMLTKLGRATISTKSYAPAFDGVTGKDVCDEIDGLISTKDETRFLGVGQSASTFSARIAGQDVAIKVAGGVFLSSSPMEPTLMFLGAFRFSNKIPNMELYSEKAASLGGVYKLPRLYVVASDPTYGKLITVEEHIQGPTLEAAILGGKVAPATAKALVRETLAHFGAADMVMFDTVHLRNFRFGSPATFDNLMVVDPGSLCARKSFAGNASGIVGKFEQLIDRAHQFATQLRSE